MADVDPALANSALQKISAGSSLSDLSPAEKQIVGALPPSALEAARAKRIAPKGSLKEQYTSPGPGAPQPVGLANQYSSPGPGTPPPPPAPAPSSGPTQAWTSAGGMSLPNNMTDMNPAGFEAARAKAAAGMPIPFGGAIKSAPNPFVGAPAGNSAENNGMLPNGHYAGTATYQGSSIVDPLGGLPPPPPGMAAGGSAPTPVASTPGEAARVGARMAKMNEMPTSSAPIIPPNMKGPDLANIIGNVLQVLGSGGLAFGGKYVPTIKTQQLQSQIQMQMAQKQADIELEQKKKLLPIELQNQIDAARASGDINRINAILEAKGLQPYKLEQIRESARLSAAGIRNPEGAALGIFGQ